MSEADHKIYFDAVLTPNRSLSPRAFLVVMGIIGAVSFLAGMAFLSMGAFPVIGFFGLDALAIWFAFRWNFSTLNQETRIRVTADAVRLEHQAPGQAMRKAEIPTGFARVQLTFPERRQSELTIAHGRSSWVIGRFLTGSERRSLADALEQAIRHARSERYPA